MKKELFLLSAITISAHAEKKQLRPNIVVFMSDDAGTDFGCYGNTGIKTPTIDSLAIAGVRFSNAYVTSPQSSPSRTSMLSGQFAHTINTEDLDSPLPDGVKVLPYYLQQLGYKTGIQLKDHIGSNGNSQFNEKITGGYNSDGTGLWSTTIPAFASFIDRAGTDPFFVWVGFVDPHRGYKNTACPQINPVEGVFVPPYLFESNPTRRDIADYYDEISRSDKDMRAMIEEIRKRGKLDNTIFIYLSDNGFPFPHGKGSLYDAGIRTPLVISGAGIPAGKVHDNGLISTIDLTPTILDLAGMDTVPMQMYGESFKPIILDPTKRGREYIFSERNWHGGAQEYIRCVRTEQYKYIWNGRPDIGFVFPGEISTSPTNTEIKNRLASSILTSAQTSAFASTRPEVEVYDVVNDPFEINNIATVNPTNTALLRTELDKWQLATNDKTPAEEIAKEALRTYKQQSVNILKNGLAVLNFEDLMEGDEIYAYASPADDEVLVSFNVGNQTFTSSPAKLKVGTENITTSAIFQKKNIFYKEGFGTKTTAGTIALSAHTGFEWPGTTYTGDAVVFPTTGSAIAPENADIYFQSKKLLVTFNAPIKGKNLQLKMRLFPVQSGTIPNFLDSVDMATLRILVNGKQIQRFNLNKVRYFTSGKGIKVMNAPFTVLSLDTITTIKTLEIGNNGITTTSYKMYLDDISIVGDSCENPTSVPNAGIDASVNIYSTKTGFCVNGLQIGSVITVYNLWGRVLFSKQVVSTNMHFKNDLLHNGGVYVLSGLDKNGVKVHFKVLF